MQKYIPHLLFGAVFIVAIVGLVLNFTESTTGNVVVPTQACTKVNPAWVNCINQNGGCPQSQPYQFTANLNGIDTCCCKLIDSQLS